MASVVTLTLKNGRRCIALRENGNFLGAMQVISPDMPLTQFVHIVSVAASAVERGLRPKMMRKIITTVAPATGRKSYELEPLTW